MNWPEVYLGAAVAVATLCWLAGARALKALSVLMVVSWFFENLWTIKLGWDVAPPAIAMTDVALAFFVMRIGQRLGAARVCHIMIGLFAARFAVQIVAVVAGGFYGYVFYAMLNLLYAALLGTLAGGALGELASHRSVDRWRRIGSRLRADLRLGREPRREG